MSVYIIHMNLIAGDKLAELVVLVSSRLGLNLALVPQHRPCCKNIRGETGPRVCSYLDLMMCGAAC